LTPDDNAVLLGDIIMPQVSGAPRNTAAIGPEVASRDAVAPQGAGNPH
jgi:hypothetical protein